MHILRLFSATYANIQRSEHSSNDSGIGPYIPDQLTNDDFAVSQVTDASNIVNEEKTARNLIVQARQEIAVSKMPIHLHVTTSPPDITSRGIMCEDGVIISNTSIPFETHDLNR